MEYTVLILLLPFLSFILIGLLLLYVLLGETGIWLTVTFAEAAACLLGIALYRRRCRGEERG